MALVQAHTGAMHTPAEVMERLDEQLVRGKGVRDRETWGMRTADEAPAAAARGRRLTPQEREARAQAIAQRTGEAG